MKRLLLYILIALLASSCTLAPSSRRVIEEDFVEKIDPEQRAHVWDEIEELKSQIQRDHGNPELHRRLAVLYRLAGTPRSRLLSVEAIDKAILLDPNDPSNHVEKGLTLLARRQVGEAEDSFQRALKVDPKYFEAWYQLGELEESHYLRTMCFPDHLIQSIKYFKKAYALARRDEETLFALSFLHMFRSMFRTARKYAYKAIDVSPDNPRNHLLLGVIQVQFTKFEEAQGAFNRAFELMSEEQRMPYEDISPLLPTDLRDLYLSSSPEKILEWNMKYWRELDPTPATDLNERRLEHYKRVFLATEIFTDKRLDMEGSETDRGRAVIKFELPDKKYYDLGGLMSGGWIIWQYDLPNYSFRLFFQDEFLNGNYHFPIADSRGEMSIGIMEDITQSYDFPIKYGPVQLKADVALSRGSPGTTHLDFSAGFPRSSIQTKGLAWSVVVTIFDQDWNRIFLNTTTIDPDTLASMEKLGEEILLFPFWIELMPRYLDCTCILEIANDELNLKGTWRHSFEIRDLFGKSLKLSSIMLTVPGTDGLCTDYLDPIPVYRREDGLCLGYQIYNLKRGDDNLARYRLTYSIKNPEETTSGSSLGRTLAYMWSSIRGKTDEDAPYVSSSFEQSTNMSDAVDRLRIDLEALERGSYLLVLEVEDLLTAETVEEEKLFTVTD
jgi:GWxTD domain-containing protein